MKLYVGYDPGFGNVKVCADGLTAVVQSAAYQVTDGLQGNNKSFAGLRYKEPEYVVCAGGELVAVGKDSWTVSRKPLLNMDYTSLFTHGRKMVFYAAMSELLVPDTCPDIHLMIGLPVSVTTNAETMALLKTDITKLRGEHRFEVGNKHYRMNIERVQHLAQPVGAWSDVMIRNNVRNANWKTAQVGVIDIGMNTLDLFGVIGGRLERRYLGGADLGMSFLIGQLEGYRKSDGYSREEVAALIMSGKLTVPEDMLTSYTAEVLSFIRDTWGKGIRHLSRIVLVGGGSVVIKQRLKQALESRGANVYVPQDPVTANVVGLGKMVKWQNDRNKR